MHEDKRRIESIRKALADAGVELLQVGSTPEEDGIETIEDLAYCCGVDEQPEDDVKVINDSQDVNINDLINSVVAQQLIYLDTHFRLLSIGDIQAIAGLKKVMP